LQPVKQGSSAAFEMVQHPITAFSDTRRFTYGALCSCKE